jgi:hypothetical protein
MGTISKLILLLVEGLLLNYLCFRFGILGMRTNLPLVIFCTLGVLVVPQISLGDLIYGAVFLGAFFLAFESSEHQELSGAYMIYFGVLLGVAQSVNAISILLMPPVFVLFMQAGRRRPRHFILSIIYFLMVSAAYAGLLFVMELEHKIVQLIPVLTFDYSVFNSILFKLTVPFIVGSLIVHFLSLGRYSFRYPNKSKIVNYTMLFQLILSVFWSYSQLNWIYWCIPLWQQVFYFLLHLDMGSKISLSTLLLLPLSVFAWCLSIFLKY